MATRPTLSLMPTRTLSRSSTAASRMSRRQSQELVDGEDVFGDENEVPDSPITIDNEPLGHVDGPQYGYIPQTNTTSLERTRTPIQYPPLPSLQSNRGSMRKSRLPEDPVPRSQTVHGPSRSASTASRLTISQAQNPYSGSERPQHDYDNYSRIHRNPSLSSMSTTRTVQETSLVTSGGPSHPYHLYPQNTVADDDEDITAAGIPLGFPGNSSMHRNGVETSNEMGEIMAFNGHLESLPPYSRYADNTVAKGNMDEINGQRLSRPASRASIAASLRSSALMAPVISAVGSSTAVASSHDDSDTLLPTQEDHDEHQEEEQARKEGWKEKAKKRTVFGLRVWVLALIVFVLLCVIIAANLLGILIGRRQGKRYAYANGAVTTVWLDAIPTTTGPGTSPLPTGNYQVPLNQSYEIKNCIPSEADIPAWGCMDIAYIDINVTRPNPLGPYYAAFEDIDTTSSSFSYGPQPPDFNGTAFQLQPMADKDQGQLGVAMFFSVSFDKLSIVPEAVLQPPVNKRAADIERVDRNFLQGRAADYDGRPLLPGERPWFCYWNGTISEFFVYLNQAAPTVPTTTQYKEYSHSYASAASDTSATAMAITQSPTMVESTATTTAYPFVGLTSFQAFNPVYTPPQAAATSTSPQQKRNYETPSPGASNYPKLIKVVEKRRPDNNVQPYCQKMLVLDDFQIVPLLQVPPILIAEVSYGNGSDANTTDWTTNNKRDLFSARRLLGHDAKQQADGVGVPAYMEPQSVQDTIADLESFCICEWTSY